MTFVAQVQSRKIDSIHPNPNQPRKFFDQAELENLAESIKVNGLLQPITITKQGLLVAGERRFRACQLLGMTTIPCIVKDMTDEQVATAAIIENLQRRDVTPMEEARAYQEMLDNGYAIDVKDLAKKLGIKQHFRVSDRLKLLKCIPAAQQAFTNGQVTSNGAWYLAQLDERKQQLLLDAILKGKCTTDAKLKAQYEAVQSLNTEMAIEETGLGLNVPDPKIQSQVNTLQLQIESIAANLSSIATNEVIEKADGYIPNHQAEVMAQILANLAKTAKQLEGQMLKQAASSQLRAV